MSRPVKNKAVKFAFIVLTTLISISIWSFQKIEEETYRILEAIVMLGLLIIFITHARIFTKKNLLFKTNVYLFILVPLLSAFGAFIYHDQPFNLSLILLRTGLVVEVNI